jgi:hypothetical protein
MDTLGFIAAIGSLIITVIGWGYTWTKQNELAQTQKEIQKSISEHNIRFETLHLERTKIMENIYGQLVEISNRAGKRNFPEVENLISKLWHYYELHDLFIDPALSKKIKNMMNSLFELGIKGIASGNAYKEGYIDVAEDFHARAEEIIEKEIPHLKEEIKEEMQKILGVLE